LRSYWKQCFILSDNRIPALQSDTSTYQFAVQPGGGEITISAELLFRRNFQSEMDARGWTSPDTLMQSELIKLPEKTVFRIFLPHVETIQIKQTPFRVFFLR
jgi:hypothetical protein